MSRHRRQAGEGTIAEYRLKNGSVRYLIKVLETRPDGSVRQILRRKDLEGKPFTTKKEAAAGIRQLQSEIDRPEGFQEPSRQPTSEYLDRWVDGLRLAPQTVASYRRLVRLHMKPHIGGVPLGRLTAGRIKVMYRELETNGRADGKDGGLSAKTVRYIATVLHKALKDAVTEGLIPMNPCDKADPPPARAAKSPEMKVWTAEQVRIFMRWAEQYPLDSMQQTLFQLGFATGARRGELLALRWQDIDFEAGQVSIRRSLGSVRRHGSPSELIEGPTKTGKARVVDIDEATVAALRSLQRSRACLAFPLATSEALVFGDIEGQFLIPDSQSWAFNNAQANCRKWQLERARQGAESDVVEVELLPLIRFHDIRHTHATILLRAGVHPKIVMERLGHSNITTTMETYSHVLPTMQKEAAQAIGRALYGA